jgi:hypothetical protein
MGAVDSQSNNEIFFIKGIKVMTKAYLIFFLILFPIFIWISTTTGFVENYFVFHIIICGFLGGGAPLAINGAMKYFASKGLK